MLLRVPYLAHFLSINAQSMCQSIYHGNILQFMQILNMTYQIIIVVNKKTKGRHASEVSVECGLGRGVEKAWMATSVNAKM